VANPAVTYTLTNGQTADASQVMQNFNDIINALTDGTKTLSIDALTCAGSVSLQGNVTLGNGSVDDITFSGSLASTVPIKTNNSFDLGSSTLGMAGVYLGAPSSRTIRLRANQSIAASYTLVLPATSGSSGDYMESDGSGGLSFVPVRRGPATATNFGLSASVASNQLTITLLGADGSGISSSNPVHLVARNATVTTGTPTVNTLTSTPTSIVLPNGASLGHASAQNQYVYVYVIFGSTTEIAVTGQPIIDELSLQSATAVTAGSTSGATLYATSNHTSKPVRFVGRLRSNQTVAGTWASSIDEISLAHRAQSPQPRSTVQVNSGNGHGSTNTKIRRFTTTLKNIGTAITYADSATNGATFSINEDGVYAISYVDTYSAGGANFGISVNSNQLTTNVATITDSHLVILNESSTNAKNIASATVPLTVGDIVRAHTDGNPNGSTNINSRFIITQVSR
jgi:hypothetical protein